jgi:hypothetical protein
MVVSIVDDDVVVAVIVAVVVHGGHCENHIIVGETNIVDERGIRK